MEDKRVDKLAQKWLNGTISEDELTELESWYIDFDSLEQKIESMLNEKAFGERIYHQIAEKAGITQRSRSLPRHWLRVAVAASVLLFLSAGFYFYRSINSGKNRSEIANNQAPDIQPGGNAAVLTLSNGNKIVLTGAANGKIANEHNVAIRKTSEGSIAYAVNSGSANDVIYNTITTPRAGQYKLVLSDGTVAILDAESSIRYPVALDGAERNVEITGQVYFEVTHNPSRPFSVKAGGQVIKDLGTHFNISAYADEPEVKTVLAEGKAAVTSLGQTVLLNPGEQASTQTNHTSIRVTKVDVEETLAWKNGYFRFNDEKIESVMRKISRWYNVDVKYESKISDDGFSGTISRSKNISQVLKMLTKTESVKLKLEGRRIIVTQ